MRVVGGSRSPVGYIFGCPNIYAIDRALARFRRAKGRIGIPIHPPAILDVLFYGGLIRLV